LIGLATLSKGSEPAGLVLLVSGVVFVGVFAYRPGLWVTATGIRVRNFVTAFDLPWTEIRSIRIGRHKLLPLSCLVDLNDGTSRYVAALQLSNWSAGKPNAPERQLVARLTATLNHHRGEQVQAS
jgi:hypothetical protein